MFNVTLEDIKICSALRDLVDLFITKYLQRYHISFVEPCLNFSVHFPMNSVNKKLGSWAESHAQWLIHQMKLSARYCGNFEFITFSRRILERVFVGNIVNIRNECLFFWIHRKWIVARNKQIAREPLRGSRDLLVPSYDSFPMNPEKRHSFLNYLRHKIINSQHINILLLCKIKRKACTFKLFAFIQKAAHTFLVYIAIHVHWRIEFES